MNINQQPIEKRELRQDGTLSVHSIFHTIQGEGPFCGTPCVFVRLAGCNLQCPSCDTDYTFGRERMSLTEIVMAIRLKQPRGLVVVTGGEPFRQNLTTLFEALCNAGYYVQVESNGTLAAPVCHADDSWHYNTTVNLSERKGVYIVCSPKTAGLNQHTVMNACALKYVVAAGQVEDDGLPSHALNHTSRPMRPPPNWGNRLVYIQPMDEQEEHKNVLHRIVATGSSLKHGFTLQLQIHKLIGVE